MSARLKLKKLKKRIEIIESYGRHCEYEMKLMRGLLDEKFLKIMAIDFRAFYAYFEEMRSFRSFPWQEYKDKITNETTASWLKEVK